MSGMAWFCLGVVAFPLVLVCFSVLVGLVAPAWFWDR